MLSGTACALGGLAATASTAARAADSRRAAESFRYCFNTSTIRGQKLSIVEQVDVAAKAGYDGIEPWLGDIESYVKSGGSLDDLRKRIFDAGLTVESAIAFASWIVDDGARRADGLERAKRDMDAVAAIGGARIAAPPAGATRDVEVNLLKAAERYGALLKVGENAGVTPQVEVWGFSTTLSRLGEALFVASESGHGNACVLPDVYHLYKGGSDFAGLKFLSPQSMHVFHVNDYPADPPREKIGDSDRVYPGDGVAPWKQILTTLRDVGFRGALSLELFNRDYWNQNAQEVARTGLRKTREIVEKVLG